VDYPLTPGKHDKQFKRALELGASFAGKLERAPSGELIFSLKDLKTKEVRNCPAVQAAEMFGARKSDSNA